VNRRLEVIIYENGKRVVLVYYADNETRYGYFTTYRLSTIRREVEEQVL
jgi:hypothetical protein